MNNGINLAIRRKQHALLVSSSRIRQLRFLSLVFLFSVGGLSVFLFIVISTSPLPSLREQEQKASAVLTANQEKFGKYLLLRNQLALIKTLLSERPNLSKGIETFLSLIPQEVAVSKIHLTERTISFDVTSSSLTALQTLFDTIAVKAQQRVVPVNVETGPIGEVNGEYTFNVAFK